DLALRESRVTAEAETRAGVRRLIALGAKGALSAIAARLPPPPPAESGAPTPRAEADAFRGVLLDKIVDEAFGLATAALPRAKPAFDALVASGLRDLEPSARRVAAAITAVTSELGTTQKALRSAAQHPSGRLASADARAQLAQLLPSEWARRYPLARLAHLPRYLKAIRVRLDRALADPRKDAAKLEPLAPVWAAFLATRGTARDAAAVDALRWDLEELRVAIFAPELRPQGAVSLAKAKAALAALR
ncbi:MAG TPA: DUF3418 domain-containing protein, partial [Polyangiaceae bacterium]|nr:DUF3418 domain-containing protein [Polyangiaceae bacterium]